MNPSKYILIVEDEPAVSALIATTLRMANYEITIAQNAEQAQYALLSTQYAAMVIDWMLPYTNGLNFIAQLRQTSQFRPLPILMLTAKTQENDKIQGLEAGADDYLTKPFSPRELVARINALIRRSQPLQDTTDITVGYVSLNPAQKTVYYHPNLTVFNTIAIDIYPDNTVKSIVLSHTEFKLLHCLMLQPKRVYSREQLLNHVWNTDHLIDVRTVDAHIKRLRQALSAVGCVLYIHTVRGFGYTLNNTVSL